MLAEPPPDDLRTTFQRLLNLALTRGRATPSSCDLGRKPSPPLMLSRMNIRTPKLTVLRRLTTRSIASTAMADRLRKRRQAPSFDSSALALRSTNSGMESRIGRPSNRVYCWWTIWETWLGSTSA
jgi:hypothetical protein